MPDNDSRHRSKPDPSDRDSEDGAPPMPPTGLTGMDGLELYDTEEEMEQNESSTRPKKKLTREEVLLERDDESPIRRANNRRVGGSWEGSGVPTGKWGHDKFDDRHDKSRGRVKQEFREPPRATRDTQPRRDYDRDTRRPRDYDVGHRDSKPTRKDSSSSREAKSRERPRDYDRDRNYDKDRPKSTSKRPSDSHPNRKPDTVRKPDHRRRSKSPAANSRRRSKSPADRRNRRRSRSPPKAQKSPVRTRPKSPSASRSPTRSRTNSSREPTPPAKRVEGPSLPGAKPPTWSDSNHSDTEVEKTPARDSVAPAREVSEDENEDGVTVNMSRQNTENDKEDTMDAAAEAEERRNIAENRETMDDAEGGPKRTTDKSAYSERYKTKSRGVEFQAKRAMADAVREDDDGEEAEKKQLEKDQRQKDAMNYFTENNDDYAKDWDNERKQESARYRAERENERAARRNRRPSESGEEVSGSSRSPSEARNGPQSRPRPRSRSQTRSRTRSRSNSMDGLDDESKTLLAQFEKAKKRDTIEKSRTYRTFKGKPDYKDPDKPDDDLDLNKDEEQMIWAFQHGVFGRGRGHRGGPDRRPRGGRSARRGWSSMTARDRSRSRSPSPPSERYRGRSPDGYRGGRGGGRGRGGRWGGRDRDHHPGDRDHHLSRPDRNGWVAKQKFSSKAYDFFKDPSKPFPFEGSGPNHILGKTKYFPGKYGFAAGSDSSDDEPSNGFRGGRGRRVGRMMKQERRDAMNVTKWEDLTSKDNARILRPDEVAENIARRRGFKALLPRHSPDYDAGKNSDSGKEELEGSKPWWNSFTEKEDGTVEPKEGFDVFNPPNEPGFKQLPRSKFHPSFGPVKDNDDESVYEAPVPKRGGQINVNIKSKFTDIGGVPDAPPQPKSKLDNGPLDIESLRAKLKAEIMADLTSQVKTEVGADLKKQVQQETEKIRTQQKEYEQNLHNKVVGSVMAGPRTGDEIQDQVMDDSQQEYLKSLKKWIQENATTQDEAWTMFWDAYKNQQIANGAYSDDTEAHHQSVAYWWFGQAFANDDSLDAAPTGQVKQETTKRQAGGGDDTGISNKRIKQEAGSNANKTAEATAAKQAEVSSKFKNKLSQLSNLLQGAKEAIKEGNQSPAEPGNETGGGAVEDSHYAEVGNSRYEQERQAEEEAKAAEDRRRMEEYAEELAREEKRSVPENEARYQQGHQYHRGGPGHYALPPEPASLSDPIAAQAMAAMPGLMHGLLPPGLPAPGQLPGLAGIPAPTLPAPGMIPMPGMIPGMVPGFPAGHGQQQRRRHKYQHSSSSSDSDETSKRKGRIERVGDRKSGRTRERSPYKQRSSRSVFYDDNNINDDDYASQMRAYKGLKHRTQLEKAARRHYKE